MCITNAREATFYPECVMQNKWDAAGSFDAKELDPYHRHKAALMSYTQAMSADKKLKLWKRKGNGLSSWGRSHHLLCGLDISAIKYTVLACSLPTMRSNFLKVHQIPNWETWLEWVALIILLDLWTVVVLTVFSHFLKLLLAKSINTVAVKITTITHVMIFIHKQKRNAPLVEYWLADELAGVWSTFIRYEILPQVSRF